MKENTRVSIQANYTNRKRIINQRTYLNSIVQNLHISITVKKTLPSIQEQFFSLFSDFFHYQTYASV